jgi:hypothetical protein
MPGRYLILLVISFTVLLLSPAWAVSNNFTISVSTTLAMPTGDVLHYLRPAGSDTNCNGTANVDDSVGVRPNCGWATPNHSINCGDVIVTAAGSYSGFGTFNNGNWGTVSNCPSTSGGIDGMGGIYFAVLLCAGPDVGSCSVNGGSVEAFRVDQSHWAVEGFTATQNTNATAGCYNAENDSSEQKFVAFINDIASTCDLSGYTASGGGCGSVCGSFDYMAAVGVLAFNAANSISPFCGSGISMSPGVPDKTLSGTHIFIAGYFGAYNTNAPGGCTVGRSPPHSDGEGIIFDTYAGGYSGGYNKQVVLEQAVIWHSGNACVEAFPNGNGTSDDLAQYKVLNVTCYSNEQDSQANCNGELFLNNVYPTSTGSWTVQKNIFYAPNTPPCVGATGAGAVVTNNPTHPTLANPPINISGNYIWSATPPTTNTTGPNNTYVVNGPGPTFNAPWVFGTNTYADPGLASPNSLFSSSPNCAGYASVTDCMNTGFSVYAHVTPSIAPTTIGYAPPGACTPDPLFPIWLKGIVYLQWDGTKVVQKAGLITMPCGM